MNSKYEKSASNREKNSSNSRFKKPKYEKMVNFSLNEEEENGDEEEEAGSDEINYQEASYLQTTLIPIYYAKNEQV